MCTKTSSTFAFSANETDRQSSSIFLLERPFNISKMVQGILKIKTVLTSIIFYLEETLTALVTVIKKPSYLVFSNNHLCPTVYVQNQDNLNRELYSLGLNKSKLCCNVLGIGYILYTYCNILETTRIDCNIFF